MFEAQVSRCLSFILLLFFLQAQVNFQVDIFSFLLIFQLPTITTSSSHKFAVMENSPPSNFELFFCFNFNCIKNSYTKIRNVENDNFHMTRRHFTTNEGDN